MHIYEYLFAGLILIAILLASSMIAATMPNPQLSVSEKEDVKTEAEKIMTQILLDPGQPYNWGSDTSIDQTKLTGFGLAKYGESTREAYVLDPDNVQRLDSDNAGALYIPPNTTATLLNLAGEYGFTLEIHPVLNVTKSETSTSKYTVTVTSEYQTIPIVNARINSTLFYYNSGGIINSATAANSTGFDGRCILDFSSGSLDIQTGMLTITVNYLGIHTVKNYPIGSHLEQAFLIGNNILLRSNSSIVSTNITEVITTKQSDQYVISSFNSTASNNGPQDYQLAFDEPTMFMVLAPSSDYQTLIYASRNVDLIYSTIPQLASSTASPLLSYTLERTAMIGDTAYTVSLMLWRMSF